MRMIPVESTNIAAIGYDQAQRELRVDFIGGSSYTHINVPPDIFAAFMSAESYGRHYNANIKVHFPHRRTDQMPARPSARPELIEPTKQEVIEPDAKPKTADDIIRAVGLPPTTVLRGTIEALLERHSADTIIRNYRASSNAA